MQPWASFVALGLKTYETRSWDTSHRGSLLIHAGRKIAPEGRLLYEKIRSILGPDKGLPDFRDLPRGAVLCQVTLQTTCTTEQALNSREITFLERALGDYGPGRFAWSLALERTFEPVIPARGRLGLWDFTSRKLARGGGGKTNK